LLCGIAAVSRSGYYAWLKGADEPDKDQGDYLLIKTIFDQGKGKYGWRSVKMRLPQGAMNHKKVIRLMRKYHLTAKIRRANPYRQMAKKTLAHRTFGNLLDRQFDQAAPYQAFCTDITYLPYNQRFAYLSVIKDIGSGEIVAWQLAENLTMPIVLDTLKNLKAGIDSVILNGIVIHSDQGFHYTHPDYINEVRNLALVQSMSRKGNCIDNAPVESFFGHFKDDVDYRSCRTFEELRQKVTEYMYFYNHDRYQWELKKMTPVGYRNHLLAVCV
jgi:transposase InsO family protein